MLQNTFNTAYVIIEEIKQNKADSFSSIIVKITIDPIIPNTKVRIAMHPKIFSA